MRRTFISPESVSPDRRRDIGSDGRAGAGAVSGTAHCLWVLLPLRLRSNQESWRMAWVCRGERNIRAAHVALVARLLNKKPKFVIDEADDDGDDAATAAVGLRAWFGLGPLGSNYDDRNPILRSGIFRSLSISTRLNNC